MIKNKNKVPISPLDCFYEPNKDINTSYATFNLFDYNYYLKKGFDVENYSFNLESVFDFIYKEFENKEKRIINCEINQTEYQINLHEFYSYLRPGNAYKQSFRRLVKAKTEYLINDRYYYRRGGDKKGFLLKKLTKTLWTNTVELFSKEKILVESHPSLKGKFLGNNLLINKLFNLLYKNKIDRIYKTIWAQNNDYFDNDFKTYGRALKQLISSLLYLDFKKYHEIVISSFVAPQQQAAISYAKFTKSKIKIVQHGRFMVHHLPGIIQAYFYKGKNILFWEKEFLMKMNIPETQISNFNIKRISIRKNKAKNNYVLIATSLPMIIDLDIYYSFWTVMIEFHKICPLPFRLKLHKMDLLTMEFLKFFSFSIDLIEDIDEAPQFAIVLNSTIYYELLTVCRVFDFKHNSTITDLEKFLKIA